MLQNELIHMPQFYLLIICSWYKICLISFDRLIVKMILWKEKKSM